jgi:hypothetical protein
MFNGDLQITESCQEAWAVALKYEMNHEKKAIWQHTKSSYAPPILPRSELPSITFCLGTMALGDEA